MPFEMMCVVVANSPALGFAPGDYFIRYGWWYFHRNNPAPHENDLAKKLNHESKGMGKKREKRLVVCPERYVVIEDLNLSSLRISRPDFCTVSIPGCGSAGQRHGIPDFQRFKNIPVLHYTV